MKYIVLNDKVTYTIQVFSIIWIAIGLALIVHMVAEVHFIDDHVHGSQPFCHCHTVSTLTE